MSETHPTEDPVVVYDTMRESATRLMAEYRSRLTIGGLEDPAMQEMRSILAQAEGVDAHDIAAQKKATAEFNARYEVLRSPDDFALSAVDLDRIFTKRIAVWRLSGVAPATDPLEGGPPFDES